MEAQLANSVAEAYRKNHTIEGYLQDSSGPDIDIEVGKVSVEDLRSAPYFLLARSYVFDAACKYLFVTIQRPCRKWRAPEK
jgi:hypothetical protein